MRGYPVDIKIKSSIWIVDDKDIKHGNPSVGLNLFCPFDVRMYGVELVMQWLYVVVLVELSK